MRNEKRELYREHVSRLRKLLPAFCLSRSLTQRERLRGEIASLIIRPSILLEAVPSAVDPALRADSYAVSDAFESVTNGIRDDALIDRCREIPEDSPLRDWKHLTLAVHALYRGNHDAVAEHLAMIDKGTPPAALVPVLTAGMSSGTRSELGRALVDDREVLRDAVEDLVTSIENGVQDHFDDMTELIISGIEDEEAARKVAERCFREGYLRDLSPARLRQLGTARWGKRETDRVFAAAIAEEDPGLSLFLLARSTAAVLEESDPLPGELDRSLDLLARGLGTAGGLAASDRQIRPALSRYAKLIIDGIRNRLGTAEFRRFEELIAPIADRSEPEAKKADGSSHDQLELFDL